MIFKVLGTILLGGGMLGAASGWLLIKYLESRRRALLARAKDSTPRTVTHGLFGGLARMQRELSAPPAPPTSPPPHPPPSAPGAVWPVHDPHEVQMWRPTADPNARMADPPAPDDPLVRLMQQRRQLKLEQAYRELQQYLEDHPEEKK